MSAYIHIESDQGKLKWLSSIDLHLNIILLSFKLMLANTEHDQTSS
jgi:hypothetical protein